MAARTARTAQAGCYGQCARAACGTDRALIAEHPEWNMHDYCKAEVRHDRKMGHITVLTDDTRQTVADLERTGCWDDLK